MTISGNKIPLYSQIAQTLKQRLRTGEYDSTKKLPSVRTLSKEFGVSLKVIQKAIYFLEGEGLIATHHGKGMMILDGKSYDQAAILFGFIHPYSFNFAFEGQVLHYASQVFNNRNNFLITRSSEGNAEQERNIALHLLNNGVKGILLWPIENDPNAVFFEKLSQKIPIVLADRFLGHNDLPIVFHDTYQNGRAICRHFLKKLKRKKLLALIDNLNISPYKNLINGLHDEATDLGRMSNLSIMQLPISDFISKLGKSFSNEIEPYREYLNRLLKEGEYDAFFCPQGEFIDYVFVEGRICKNFPDIKVGMMCGKATDPNLTKLRELGILQWVIDYPEMMQLAADLLQKWVLTRRVPSPREIKLEILL